MGIRRFQLTERQVRDLQQQLEGSECPRTRVRLQAVLLYGTGHLPAEIQSRLGCSRASILAWCRAYRQDGASGLSNKWRGGNNARLTHNQLKDLCAKMQANTPRDLFGANAATPDGQAWTAEDLHKALKRWYGVVYKSKSSYYRLLKRCLEHLEQLQSQ